MATENRTPDDLQEAVAATLRRLRGEVGKPGATPTPAATPASAAARVEPQLSAAAPEQPAPAAAPAAKQEIIEPDLLSRSGPEIPLAPAAAKLGAEQYRLETPRNRTRLLPYALSMVAIVVFAGIVWWAYQAIVAGPNKGPVPTIAADSNPAKVPPSDQQSTETTGQQQTVYDQISGANSQPKTEVLLPTPDVPQTPPPPPTPVPSTTDAGTTTTDTGTTTAPAPAASTDSGTATQTLVPPPAPLAPATTEGTAASTTTTGTATTDTSTAATGGTSTTGTASTDTSSSTTSTTSGGGTTSGTTTTADTGSSATQPASGTDTASTASTDTGAASAVTTNPSTDAGDLYGVPTLAPTTGSTTATATAPAAPATTAATTTVASAGTSASSQPAATADFRIQLAALKSEAEANSAWKRIQSKHIDVLGSLSVHIVRADLGAQGNYYRVQAGPFPHKASAGAACDKLKSSGQQCLVKP